MLNAPAAVALPDRARVVVIGGGVIGTSVAYHLAQLWDGVVRSLHAPEPRLRDEHTRLDREKVDANQLHLYPRIDDDALIENVVQNVDDACADRRLVS